MKNKIQATLGKLTTLLAEEESSKEIMHTQNVKFRKFMFRLGNSGDLVTWSSDEFKALRRQDVSPAYFLEGSIYISFVNTFIERRTFCHSETGGYVVPKWKSLEIDDIIDFVCVEAIMSAKDLIVDLDIN